MKKNLSDLENYCSDRNIIYKITGFGKDTVYYEISTVRLDTLTDKVKKNLCKKIRNNEYDYMKVRIKFIE